MGGIGSDKGRENANRDETRQKGPRLPGNTHKRKGNMGRFACLSARPRAGYLYESESAAIQCTLQRERGGKGKGEVQRVPAGDRARGVVCEERPVFRFKTGSVLCVKARQRARGRRERQRSKSDDKGNEKWS